MATPQALALVNDLLARHLILGCVESCTGGLVSSLITQVPGCSQVFWGSYVTYANEAKIDLINVPEQLIKKFGAVSKETAEAMSTGGITKMKIDICIAITGIAGPTGGTIDKPVGTVWFSLNYHNQIKDTQKQLFTGSRKSIQLQAAHFALKYTSDFLTKNNLMK